ncbi:hypothetical protein TraAM80_06364 [Trypanosoma rangeli]|uniref:Uncharacterized protein n=1 Tax=Trypanosoma rangeli TaxID=5698 RepID=A0A3R7RGW5_TRYRA|nr:uncharacterized protein TraAM80_06364 [Trypanosoma rangeli]RNF02458.1 hypothetical protein TraAM80_06364 [Trypanosoma rangeli]|eukprot:RNF02458.1 hypothetical protein TraAM80_06364 [Trypanosoma rangeli]
MSGGATVRDGAIGVHQRPLGQMQQSQRQTHQPRQQPQQQLQQPQPSQQSEAGEAYCYLLRHGVPGRVENIFSGVLNEQPEDPLQYILEHMRVSGGKSAGKDCSIRTANCKSSNESRRDSQQLSECAPVQREVITEEARDNKKPTDRDSAAPEVKEGEVEERCLEEKAPIEDEEVEHLRLPPTDVATDNTFETTAKTDTETCLFPPGVVNAQATPLPEPLPKTVQTSLSATRASVCKMRPSSAMLVSWSSVRGSRNETPYGPAALRFPTAGGENTHSGPGTAALDRDDSTRSDLSAFSLASVDVQDFLQEFRSAKADCVGEETQLVDIEMLSEILQCVNIPLPETPLIAELFDDVKRISVMQYNHGGLPGEEENDAAIPAATSCAAEVESRERVYFDAFLARMAYMIQGRYPTEVVRGTFYSILKSVVQKKCPADGVAREQQQQKFSGNETRYTSYSSGNATGRSIRAAPKNNCRSRSNTFTNSAESNPTTVSGPNSTAMQTYPGVPRAESTHCAAANDGQPAAELSTLLHGVSLAVCVEKGLWRGLGIPVSKAEVINALQILGIPVDDNYEFHVNEFVRLVMALTGQSVLHSVGEKTTPWMMSSLGRENSLMPLGGSCKEESL